jgi:hypothetical protein
MQTQKKIISIRIRARRLLACCFVEMDEREKTTNSEFLSVKKSLFGHFYTIELASEHELNERKKNHTHTVKVFVVRVCCK